MDVDEDSFSLGFWNAPQPQPLLRPEPMASRFNLTWLDDDIGLVDYDRQFLAPEPTF